MIDKWYYKYILIKLFQIYMKVDRIKIIGNMDDKYMSCTCNVRLYGGLAANISNIKYCK